MDERRLKELFNQSKQLYSKDSVFRFDDYKWIYPAPIEPTPPQHDGVETIASIMGRQEKVLLPKKIIAF